ncbi:MAG TPA: dienelactone hydrolase family protein [Blastocatellia bacterium]|jgi:dienelactone hydrolase|nr:dienelactone hydrolase family protein [Blastocatellia bacterium]
MKYLLLLAVLIQTVAIQAESNGVAGPRAVVIQSGTAQLRGLFWLPRGRGPFPAILFNHGSGRTREELERLGPYERRAETLGPVFARHGYAFLYLFRRGVGLSADQGANSVDLMNAEFTAHGQDARNAIQLQLLENREINDSLAGLAFLRALPEVDARRIAAVGESFGGSLTVLEAERDSAIRAAVIFSCAGYSWDKSPQLRARLLAAVDRVAPPIFFIHAANDYSLGPGKALDAELSRLRKSHSLKIYPPVGQSAEDGHAFLYRRVSTWEPDVFAFLDKHMRRRASRPPARRVSGPPISGASRGSGFE